MITGILLGLGAALFHSLSYLATRQFVMHFGGRPLRLLVMAHLMMGAVCLAGLPFLWADEMPPVSAYGHHALGVALCYLGGQVFLLRALRQSHASRVSPLLGIKIFFIALVQALLLGRVLNAWQWAAVGASVCAAGALSWSRAKFDWHSLKWIAVACFMYTGSDLSIVELVKEFEHLGLTQASMISTCFSYVICGAVSAVAIFFLPPTTGKMWAGAIPFAATWLVAIFFLFGCFGSVGVVLGTILQSLRGIISIMLGYFVARAGLDTLEERVDKTVLLARIAAALLMTSAVGLYYWQGVG